MVHSANDGDDRQDGATVAVVTVFVVVVGVTTRSSVLVDPSLSEAVRCSDSRRSVVRAELLVISDCCL